MILAARIQLLTGPLEPIGQAAAGPQGVDKPGEVGNSEPAVNTVKLSIFERAGGRLHVVGGGFDHPSAVPAARANFPAVFDHLDGF